METASLPGRRPRTLIAFLVLLLCVPSLVFVVANVMAFELGLPGIYDLLEPAIAPRSELGEALVALLVVAGPITALAAIAVDLLRVRLDRDPEGSFLRLEVRLACGTWLSRWAVGLLGAIGTYLFLENVRIPFD